MAREEGHAKAGRTGAAGCRGDGVPSGVQQSIYHTRMGEKRFD